MRRKLVPILIALLVTAGGLLVVLGLRSNNNNSAVNSRSSQNQSQKKVNVVNPCSVLTQQVAEGILGGPSKQQNVQIDTIRTDISPGACIYVRDTNTGTPISPAKVKTASLYAYSARTKEGIAINKNRVTKSKPASAQEVRGYGEVAFWDRTRGELTILKNNNVYILVNGSDNIDNRKLEDALKLADQILSQL